MPLGDIRVFSIGIETIPPFDTVVEVAKAGKGSYDFVREPKDIGPCLCSMLSKTAGTDASYTYCNVLDVAMDAEIIECISEGSLDMQGFGKGAIQIPSPNHNPKFFTNERLSLYLVFKSDIPESVVFNFNNREYRCHSNEFLRCNEDDVVKEALKRELAYRINKEFDMSVYSVYDKAIEENAPLKRKRQEYDFKGFSSEEILTVHHPENGLVWKLYENQIRFVMKHDLLTVDTLMMIGSNLKSRDAWIDRKMDLIEQYVTKQAEKLLNISSSPYDSFDCDDGSLMATVPWEAEGFPRSRDPKYLREWSSIEFRDILGKIIRIFENDIGNESTVDDAPEEDDNMDAPEEDDNMDASEEDDNMDASEEDDNISSKSIMGIILNSKQDSNFITRFNSILDEHNVDCHISGDFIQKIREDAIKLKISKPLAMKRLLLIKIITDILGVNNEECVIFVTHQMQALKIQLRKGRVGN